MQPLSRTILWSLLALVLVVSTACTKDTTDTTDTDGNTETGPTAQEELCADYPDNIACPTLPAPPAPPQLEDGTDFSNWEPSQCPTGAMPDFGKPGCIVIGEPCPEGDWPENLPTENVRFVTPGGSGDGRTKERAAGSIRQTLTFSELGTTVVLSKGRFEESLDVTKGQQIVGTCAKDTVIVGQAAKGHVVGIGGGEGASLKNVTVTGPTVGVLVDDNAIGVTLEGVQIADVQGAGILVDKDSVVISDEIHVVRVEPFANGSFGRCLNIQAGANFRMRAGILEGCPDNGLYADGMNTQVELVKTAVMRAGKPASSAIWNFNDASVVLKRVLLLESSSIGILVAGTGSPSLEAEDVVIRDVILQSGDSGGIGVNLEGAGSVALSRVLIQRAGRLGVFTVGPSSGLLAQDLTIEDTLDAGIDALNAGIGIGPGTSVEIERARLSRNSGGGIAAGGDGSKTIVLNDVRIESSSLSSAGVGDGDGISIQDEASLSVSRLYLEDNARVGILLGRPGVQGSFEDVVVRGTRMKPEGWGGAGISIQDGAILSFSRVLLDENHENGLGVLYPDAEASFEDLVVQNTRSITNGLQGIGVSIQEGARLQLTRAVLRNNRSSGILAIGEETSLGLDSVEIRETRPSACGEDSEWECPMPGNGYGDGILVLGDVELRLNDFIIENNARVGLHLYDTTGSGLDAPPNDIFGQPSIDVRSGTVLGNAYGINFRQGDITPANFAGKEVACYDNFSTVDGCYSEMQLEVPSPAEALEGIEDLSK